MITTKPLPGKYDKTNNTHTQEGKKDLPWCAAVSKAPSSCFCPSVARAAKWWADFGILCGKTVQRQCGWQSCFVVFELLFWRIMMSGKHGRLVGCCLLWLLNVFAQTMGLSEANYSCKYIQLYEWITIPVRAILFVCSMYYRSPRCCDSCNWIDWLKAKKWPVWNRRTGEVG